MVICRSWSTFVRNIRAVSVSCSCYILAISVCEFTQGYATDVTPRTWHEYDKDITNAARTWHGCDTDLIRTFVRVSYFDCLKIIDTDKFGPGDRGGHDTGVIRTWTGRQGHDTNTCPCHVRLPIRVCVNVALDGPMSSCCHDMFAGSNLYECLCHYTHPPHQLASHGYPRPVLGSPGTVTIVVPRTFEDCLSSIRKSAFFS